MTSILRKPSKEGQFKSSILSTRRGALQTGVLFPRRNTPVLVDHPDLAQVYRGIVQNLEDALSDASTAAAAATALRCMIDRIFIHPLPGWGQSGKELRGDLAAFLYMAGTAKTGTIPCEGDGAGLCGSGVVSTLVAGACSHLDLLVGSCVYGGPSGLALKVGADASSVNNKVYAQ